MTSLNKPITRKVADVLGPGYGPDRDKPLVVSIMPSAAGTIIELRPHRTRRGVSILVEDLYADLIRRQVARRVLERARRVVERRKARRSMIRVKMRGRVQT